MAAASTLARAAVLAGVLAGPAVAEVRVDWAAGRVTATGIGLADRQAPNPAVAVVTGFYIPHATPPCGETDGPLGALFLARALTPLGIRVALVTDTFCARALQVGLAACGLQGKVQLLTLPGPDRPSCR